MMLDPLYVQTGPVMILRRLAMGIPLSHRVLETGYEVGDVAVEARKGEAAI
jgi:hypothetical protein